VLRDQLETAPPPLPALRPGVPQPIEDLVGRLLAKDPNRRPSSIFAFLEELAAVRAGVPVVMA
jgi:serine/threonine protein kinase